ncbi:MULTISPECIES: hypothetical protein [unclassified Streptomyces]|uniref:hypothetical protein n=1 Tax=unclassified Streptomyces TaxID=2593676 RepID=UPI0036E8829B
MSYVLAANLSVIVAMALLVGRMYETNARHVRHLQNEVRQLGGEDRWNARCTHCRRRIWDSASIRYATRAPAENGWTERTDGVFHMDRTACAAAADAMAAGR